MAKKNFRINYPASKKIYVDGTVHPIRVAMREIQLTDSVITIDGEEKLKSNKSVTVYDTSGPYSDPKIKIDIEKDFLVYVKNGIRSEKTSYNSRKSHLTTEKSA